MTQQTTAGPRLVTQRTGPPRALAPVPTSDSGQGRYRVVIVDDQQLIGEALAAALAGHGVRAVLATLDPLPTLVERIVAEEPDLVILDLMLGPALQGETLVRPLVEAHQRVLVVTGTTDLERVAEAIERGAVGVVSKNGSLGRLVRTIADVTRGEPAMTPAARDRLVDAGREVRARREARLAPFARLSPREQEILRELTFGRTVSVIARRYVVSEATVRTQVRNILGKLGVGSQLEAVVAAQRSGWTHHADATG